MPKALWNGQVIAEADAGVMQKVEGNSYFPLASLKKEFFQESPTTSKCPWKGVANYFTVVVDGKTNPDAAWIYRNPLEAAKPIKDHVAFWKGVAVEA
jgi:uncharacterized protein (DUF427 family)